MKPVFQTLRVQFVLVAGLATLVVVVTTTLLVYVSMYRELVRKQESMLAMEASIMADHFGMYVKTTRRDVLSAASLPEIANLLAAARDGGPPVAPADGRKRAANTLTGIVNGNAVYWGAKLLDLEGHEIVFVARTGAFASETSAGRPGSSADSTAFQRSGTLPPGQTWVSNIQENRDVSRVANAARLVLNAVTPVVGADGERLGAVILILDIPAVGRMLRGDRDPATRFFLTDPSGRFIAHPDHRRMVMNGARGDWRLRSEFPDLRRVPEGDGRSTAVVDDWLGARTVLGSRVLRLEPFESEHFLTFTFASPYRAIVADVSPRPEPLIGAAILALLLAAPLLLVGANAIGRPLGQISAAIRAYEESGERLPLPVERSDEIGQLARAFDSLAGRNRAANHELQLLGTAIENGPTGMAVLTPDRVITYVNSAFERISGYRRDHLVGKPPLGGVEEPAYYAAIWEHVDQHQTWQGQLRSRNADGSMRIDEVSITPIRDSGGALVNYVVICQDVTERSTHEIRMRQLAAAVENAGDAIEILDRDGRIVYVNPAYERASGRKLSDVVGKLPQNLRDFQNDQSILDEMIATTRQGNTWTGRMRSRAGDGGEREEDISVSPIGDGKGSIGAFVIIKRDVTEQVTMEKQLRQAQKLESIGQLAAGIAHEINTPAQYVADNLRFLQAAFDDVSTLIGDLMRLAQAPAPEMRKELARALESADAAYLQAEIPKAVEQSLEGVERVTGIVRAMKEFSHPAQERTPVDINRAIASTITVATNEWRYVASVCTDFDEALPLVPVHPGEFNQVILNMIVNAAHAIGSATDNGARARGTITLRTRQDGDWAEISIIDTGCGMSPDIQQRIFDPFFTTKEVGKGTGQGLAIAHTSVVKKHLGEITVRSEPGVGSTFTIRLPLHLAPRVAVRAA